MDSKVLFYEFDKDTKRYAKFEPARGERATGAIYLDLGDADELAPLDAAGHRPRLIVEVKAEALVAA